MQLVANLRMHAQDIAAKLLSEYKCASDISEQEAQMDVCRLQAVQLRVSKKIVLLSSLNMTAAVLSRTEIEKAQPRRKLLAKASTSSTQFKGFGKAAKPRRRK